MDFKEQKIKVILSINKHLVDNRIKFDNNLILETEYSETKEDNQNLLWHWLIKTGYNRMSMDCNVANSFNKYLTSNLY